MRASRVSPAGARQPPVGLGQRGVAEQPARLGHRQVDVRRARPLAAEQLLDAADRRHDPRHHGIAVARVGDRRRQHVGELPGPEVAQHQRPRVERAGHDGGERAGPGDELEPALGVGAERRGGGCRALPAEHVHLALRGGPEHRRDVAARPVEVRLDHLQHEPGGHRRVERVAAALEHRHPRPGRQPVGRRDHPERAAQLGAGRERHQSIRSNAAPTTDSASIAWCS